MKKKNQSYDMQPQRRTNYLRELNGHTVRNARGEKIVRSRYSVADRGGREMYHISDRTRRRHESAHFERYASEGNRFIHEVADVLGTDNHAMALRVTRAVLHALRDRMVPDDAVEFSQGLPTMLKAIYFEEYDLSKAPVSVRRKNEFIEYIRDKNRFAAKRDFPDDRSVLDGLHAVFTVLTRHLDAGQLNHIKHLFNVEIRNLIEND